MFKYIAPVDCKIEIPESVLTWANAYVYSPGNTLNKPNIPRQVDRLIEKFNSEDIEFPVELTYKEQSVTITSEMYNSLKESKLKTLRESGFTKGPFYSRIELPESLKEELIKCFPVEIQKYNPTPILQIIEGEGMFPHTDFVRKSSLYYLLTDSVCDTMWWESNGTVDLFENANKYRFLYSIADFDHIELKKTFNLEKNKWYVFDNHTFHSVKSHQGPVVRKGLQIEFKDLFAKDLFSLFGV
jgi:hypothetical protein